MADKLRKPLQQIIEDSSRSKKWWDKIAALRLISNIWPKLNSDFLSNTLNELSKCKNREIRMKAAELLKTISIDSNDIQ